MKTLKITTVIACIAFVPNMASAAAKTPEQTFKSNCSICHSVEAGKQKGGPSLANIMGKPAGKVAGFTKYKGMIGADFIWTDENMDGFLTNPKKFLKGKTSKKPKMTSKVKKPEARALIIKYLHDH